MTVGSLFLIVAFVLWFLEGLGMRPIPGAHAFAHAALAWGCCSGGIHLAGGAVHRREYCPCCCLIGLS